MQQIEPLLPPHKDAYIYLLEIESDGTMFLHRQLGHDEFRYYESKRIFKHNNHLFVKRILKIHSREEAISFVTEAWSFTQGLLNKKGVI